MPRKLGSTTNAGRATRRRIRTEYARLGSVRATARHTGLSPSYVSRVVSTTRRRAKRQSTRYFWVDRIIQKILHDRRQYNWTYVDIQKALFLNADLYVSTCTISRWARGITRARIEFAQALKVLLED
jgi:AraC-like DNA-binding protein